MKISTKGEYGLRALLYLAMEGEDGAIPSHLIAERQDIPEAYLRQILARLGRDDLVDAVRGPNGGYSLGRPAGEITLREVLVVLEGQTTAVDDILSLPCGIEIGTRSCAIREVLLEVKAAVENVLSSVTLADLADRQRHLLERRIPVPDDVGGLLPVIAD